MLVNIAGINFESSENGVGSPLPSFIDTTSKGPEILSSPISDPSYQINSDNVLSNENISGSVKSIQK